MQFDHLLRGVAARRLTCFRTIQTCPKDWLTPARQAPDASNRLRPAVPSAIIGSGTWEGAHARHEAAGVRQPVRRRAAAWPIAARAQQTLKHIRRVGLLSNFSERDPEVQTRLTAFRTALQETGWVEGVTCGWITDTAKVTLIVCGSLPWS